MKPIKLEIEGLNSFETKQVLNFGALGDGVFGIFGKTGSGKSTILDAITLALYGEVERSKQNIDFINIKTKKAIVAFEFELVSNAERKLYLVRRVFKIKNNGKDVDSSAYLYLVDDDGNESLVEEGVSKVDSKIFSIMGLGVREFSKCIALPQGEFSAFLKAKPAERTEIMSNIFNLSGYGEKLVWSVKSKLQEFDKQVEINSSNLNLVSYATDEALEEVTKNKTASKELYDEKSMLLSEKSKEYAEKKNNFDRQTKLDAVLAELEKLNASSEEFDALKNEIEKNQNAIAVKADYEKLKKCKLDVASLTEKISNLNEIKLKAESDVQSAQIEFDEYSSSFDTKTVELNSKLARFDDLAKLDEEAKEIEEDSSKLALQIAEKKTELSSLGEKLELIESNLSKIEGDIQKIDNFVEANKPDVDLSYALEQTKGVESEIILIDDFYKKVEALVDETELDLKAVQEEYNSSIVDEKNLQAQREKIQNSIEVAFEDVDTTNFKKLRSCDKELEGMHEVEVSVSKVDEQIQKLELDTENRMATVSNLDSNIDEAERNLSGKEEEIKNKEIELAGVREEREEMLGEGVISLISEHLKIGDLCPVCNSRVVQKVYGDKVDVASMDGEINQKQTELKALRFERDKIFVEVISLKSRYEFEKAQIEINKGEIQKLTDSKNALYQRFVDNNDESKENFEKLKELLTKTADSLEDLINLQETLREAELRMTINKAQSGTKVTIYKNYLESLIDVIYDLQKKKAEREFVIYNVNEKYKNFNEYKKQIAEGKNIELLIDSKKEERVKLRDEQYRITNERTEVQKQIATCSASLDVLNEKLENSQKQVNNLKSKIVLSGVPEGVSLDEERAEVQKQIAKLKFDFDDKKTKLYSFKENLERTNHEYEVNVSILEGKRNEIDQIEKEVNDTLIRGEFSSHEELEQNFVDSSVLKLKTQKLDDYNSRVRVLEIQKSELESEISGKTSAEEIEKLTAEIASLNTEVQVLSENVGKTRSDYERFLIANKQYKEFSENLEKYKHKYDLAKELSNVLKGKALAEYVAEEYLQEITVSANEKLALLMDGRYILKFENKEFVVEDNFNDAQVRPASTLSGGETFLVSLSLALSISEAITMLSSRNMDFFFLDEGFGTLDGELCEAVVGALYKLESRNLKIGLISHVKELEDSIKNKVLIEKTQNKGSIIRIDHTL